MKRSFLKNTVYATAPLTVGGVHKTFADVITISHVVEGYIGRVFSEFCSGVTQTLKQKGQTRENIYLPCRNRQMTGDTRTSKQGFKKEGRSDAELGIF